MYEIELVTAEGSKKVEALQDTHDVEENKQIPFANIFFFLIQHKNK